MSNPAEIPVNSLPLGRILKFWAEFEEFLPIAQKMPANLPVFPILVVTTLGDASFSSTGGWLR
jgi:hypothetical protein